MIDQPTLFGGDDPAPAPPAAPPDNRAPVYRHMDRAQAEYGHLKGARATWVRLVKNQPTDLGRRGEGGLATKAIPGQGRVIGVCGGIEDYAPRLIVHECDCMAREYKPRGICDRGGRTWWVRLRDVTVETPDGYMIATDLKREGPKTK